MRKATTDLTSTHNTGKPSKYGYGGPQETAAVREQTVRDIVRLQAGLLLERPTERVRLNDTARLQTEIQRYMTLCVDHGLLPSFQGLAGVLGLSRVALYDYLRTHPDDPSGIVLERARTLFLYSRQCAVDRGAASEAQAIFLAKNTYQAYADRIEIEPVQPENKFAGLDPEAARKRVLEALPDDD